MLNCKSDIPVTESICTHATDMHREVQTKLWVSDQRRRLHINSDKSVKLHDWRNVIIDYNGRYRNFVKDKRKNIK